jgi:hypothetical protein
MPGLLSPSRYFGEMECGLLMDALWKTGDLRSYFEGSKCNGL